MNWTIETAWKNRIIAMAMGRACLFLALRAVRAGNCPDPGAPWTVGHLEMIPAGSIIVPRDNPHPSRVVAFGHKARREGPARIPFMFRSSRAAQNPMTN